MSDSQELEMYLDALRENISPFERFVSRGDKPDAVDVAEPHKKATDTLRKALRGVVADTTPRLVPIIGAAGSGKTHLYWVLYEKYVVQKEQLDNHAVTVVYTPSPPAPVRVPLHIWTCVLDDIGTDLLEVAAANLIKRFGIRKGLLRKIDEDGTIARALHEYPGITSDIVKALVIYGSRHEKSRYELAERYLLGEILTEEQMGVLGLRTIIEDDDIVFAAMRTALELYGKTVIIYFDELEIPYRVHGAEAATSFVENLKRLYNEVPNILIVAACLDEIWPKILANLDQAMRTRMELETQIIPFTVDDLIVLYEDNMRYYWEHIVNIEPPTYPLFPLKEDQFKTIHAKSKGNPRQAIKMIRAYLDAIVEGKELPTELPTPTAQRAAVTKKRADSQILTVAKEGGKVTVPPKEDGFPVIDGENSKKIPDTGKDKSVTKPQEHSAGIPVQTEGNGLNVEEDLTIEVNPQYIATGLVNTFKIIAEQQHKDLDIALEYKFEINKKEQKVAALIGIKGDATNKVIIEVPAVKDFDKKAGVAAYYALSRVKSAVDAKVAPKAIIVVPKDSAGSKYTVLKEEMEAKKQLLVLEIDNTLGEQLIRGGLTKIPSEIGIQAAKVLFPNFKP